MVVGEQVSTWPRATGRTTRQVLRAITAILRDRKPCNKIVYICYNRDIALNLAKYAAKVIKAAVPLPIELHGNRLVVEVDGELRTLNFVGIQEPKLYDERYVRGYTNIDVFYDNEHTHVGMWIYKKNHNL